jgi:hypothetical protein
LSLLRKTGKESAIVELKFNKESRSYKYNLHPIISNNLAIEVSPGHERRYAWRNFKFFFVRNIIFCRWLYYFYKSTIEPMEFYFEVSDKNWFQRLKGLNWKKISDFSKFMMNVNKEKRL